MAGEGVEQDEAEVRRCGDTAEEGTPDGGDEAEGAREEVEGEGVPAIEGGVVGEAGMSAARGKDDEPRSVAWLGGAGAGAGEPVLAGGHGSGDGIRREEGEDVGEDIQREELPHAHPGVLLSPAMR